MIHVMMTVHLKHLPTSRNVGWTVVIIPTRTTATMTTTITTVVKITQRIRRVVVIRLFVIQVVVIVVVVVVVKRCCIIHDIRRHDCGPRHPIDVHHCMLDNCVFRETIIQLHLYGCSVAFMRTCI